MSFQLILIMSLVISFFYLVRLNLTFRKVFIASVALSLIATIFILGKYIEKKEIFPKSGGNHVVLNALNAEKAGNNILFVGSSHTFRAINSEVMRKVFIKNVGREVNVISFSMGGVGLLEQDYLLDTYLSMASSYPKLIVFEVARTWDINPNKEYIRQKHADRITAYTDIKRARWAFDFALEDNGQILDSLSVLYEISKRLLLRLSNVGVLRTGTKLNDIKVRSVALRIGAQEGFDQQNVTVWSSTDEDALPSEKFNRFEWHKKFRAYQERKLKAAGVENVMYYAPPMVALKHESYAVKYCQIFKSTPCILSSSEEVKALLNGPYWHNATHLNIAGRDIYSEWLANKIVAHIQ